MSRQVRVLRLGLVSYAEGLLAQTRAASSGEDTLLLLQHSPVYTLGLRSNPSEYTSALLQDLRSRGAQVVRTRRGGLITFHGPGQLVAYPVLKLRRFASGIRAYVSSLEDVIIETAGEFGVAAGRCEHVGVWSEGEKLAALGVNVSRGVTSHGLAINCSTDLSWFDHIVPCGIAGRGVTSLSKLLSPEVITPAEAEPVLTAAFARVFSTEVLTTGANWRVPEKPYR